MSFYSTWTLRVVMILAFSGFLTVFLGGLLLAAFGEAEMVNDTFELEILLNDPIQVELWRLMIAAVLIVFFLFGLLRLFLAVDRLIKLAKIGDMASKKTGKSLRHMGSGMLVVWLGITLVEGLVPWILFSGLEPEIDYGIGIIGIETIFAVCGCALYVVARLADEAHVLKEEMAGVI